MNGPVVQLATNPSGHSYRLLIDGETRLLTGDADYALDVYQVVRARHEAVLYGRSLAETDHVDMAIKRWDDRETALTDLYTTTTEEPCHA